MLFNLLAGILAGKLENAKYNSNAVSTSAAPADFPDDNEKRTLTISRDAQALNCAVKYSVVVDGREIAKLRNGDTISCEIRSTADVKIIYHKTGISMRIRAGKNPCIRFNTSYGGSVNARVEDAAILSRSLPTR